MSFRSFPHGAGRSRAGHNAQLLSKVVIREFSSTKIQEKRPRGPGGQLRPWQRGREGREGRGKGTGRGEEAAGPGALRPGRRAGRRAGGCGLAT